MWAGSVCFQVLPMVQVVAIECTSGSSCPKRTSIGVPCSHHQVVSEGVESLTEGLETFPRTPSDSHMLLYLRVILRGFQSSQLFTYAALSLGRLPVIFQGFQPSPRASSLLPVPVILRCCIIFEFSRDSGRLPSSSSRLPGLRHLPE